MKTITELSLLNALNNIECSNKNVFILTERPENCEARIVQTVFDNEKSIKSLIKEVLDLNLQCDFIRADVFHNIVAFRIGIYVFN